MRIDWIVPEGDLVTLPAVLNEWLTKGDKVLSYVKNKNTVVQAGGNLGVFPYYLSKHFGTVLTFEPVPETYICLQRNTKDILNIIAVNNALGAKNSKADIDLVIPGNCGATNLKYTETGDIHVIALDGLALSALDLVWLDVEGFEVEALKGMSKHINNYKPVIVLENKGLIPGFGGDLDGSTKLRDWMLETFNYTLAERLMRDDIYIHVD
jgi:FkbM family methyltransferase